MSSNLNETYFPLPPILVSCTGLENYLENLNKRLAKDLKDVKNQIFLSNENIKESNELCRRIKHYLGKQSMQVLEETNATREIPKGSVPQREDNDDSSESDVAEEQQGDTVTSELVLFKLLSASKKLMRSNTQLKASLNSSVASVDAIAAQQTTLKTEIQQLKEQMNKQNTDLLELARWLGLYSAGEDGVYKARDEGQQTQEQIDNLVARAPLLLTFRRAILRDVTERMIHTSDQQVQEVANTLAQLKGDMSQLATVDNVRNILMQQQTQEEQTVVANYDKRLRQVESNYVKRDEFTSSLKTKADSLILPVKADNAQVSDVERRLVEKLADLEERIVFFESEKRDFRNVLKTLMASSSVSPLGGLKETSASPPEKVSPVSNKTNTSGVTPERGVSPDPREASSRPEQGGAKVYRVVGTNRNVVATCATVDGMSKEDKKLASVHGQRSQPKLNRDPNNEEVSREAVGMTANQAAYAQFVTGEMNKERVESLPPLSYERMHK